MKRLARVACRLYNLALPFTHLLFLALALALPARVAGQGYPWTGSGVSAPVAALPAVGPASVTRVALTVSDMERSLAFYRDILGFRVVADTEVVGPEWERLTGVFGVRIRITRIRLGDESLELWEYLASPGRPAPVDSRSNDRWFQHVAIIVSDMDSAYRVLRAHRVRQASTGPQLLPKTIPNAAGIRAFYFRDPDGHPLEILQFPPDKGDPRWQRKDRLFLGIDHTAIVVASTERSLRFYRDLLGFRVAGESENFGAEQAHLNNVEGAHLRITGLRAPGGGPGVEFLEYLAPRDGRAYPADERPSDLVHWQTTVAVPGLGALVGRLRQAGSPEVSRPAGNPDSGQGVLFRDPDGHTVRLVEP